MLLNDYQNQCDHQKCILAMSSTDPKIIKMVGKFVNAIFTVRESIHINVCSNSSCIHVSIYVCA